MNHVLEQEGLWKNTAPKIGIGGKSDAGVLRHKVASSSAPGKQGKAVPVWTAVR